VATGCLMIQGIALLEHFHKTNGVSPLDWPDQATRTGEWAGDVRRERCSVTRHANRFSDLRPSMCPSAVCSVLVRDFYRQRSAGLEAEESDGVEEVRPQPASATRPAAAAAAVVTAKSVSHRDATWRAGFALRVYEVMVRQPKDYAVVRR